MNLCPHPNFKGGMHLIAFILNLSLGPPLKSVSYRRQLATLVLYNSIKRVQIILKNVGIFLPKLLIFTFLQLSTYGNAHSTQKYACVCSQSIVGYKVGKGFTSKSGLCKLISMKMGQDLNNVQNIKDEFI